jgi:hypothetical protein
MLFAVSADLLSILAVAISFAAFAVTAATAIRDRPRLRVTGKTMRQKREGQWVLVGTHVEVANIGRQPVALTSVGLRHVPKGVSGRITRLRRRSAEGQLFPLLREWHDDPEPLEAGSIRIYETGVAPDAFLEPGVDVYPYATDSRNRVSYARTPVDQSAVKAAG